MIAAHASAVGATLVTRDKAFARALQRRVITDAARQFDVEAHLPHDLGDDIGVRATAKRRVQIHQVEPTRPAVLPALGGRQRITKGLLGPSNALGELDGLAALNVNRRQQRQGISHGRKP